MVDPSTTFHGPLRPRRGLRTSSQISALAAESAALAALSHSSLELLSGSLSSAMCWTCWTMLKNVVMKVRSCNNRIERKICRNAARFFSARIFFSSLVMETNSITLKVYRQIPTFAQEPRALSTCLGHGSSWFPQRFWVEFQRWAGGSTLGKSMNIFQGWFQFLWKQVIMMLAPPMQKILAIRRFAQDFIWPQDHKKQDLTPSSSSSSSPSFIIIIINNHW